jgi:hypothetical protein
VDRTGLVAGAAVRIDLAEDDTAGVLGACEPLRGVAGPSARLAVGAGPSLDLRSLDPRARRSVEAG